MIFLIRLIYNAVDIYSLILVAFAVMSWFPGAYESSLGRWIVALVKPVLAPLQRLPLQIAGLDLSVKAGVAKEQALVLPMLQSNDPNLIRRRLETKT